MCQSFLNVWILYDLNFGMLVPQTLLLMSSSRNRADQASNFISVQWTFSATFLLVIGEGPCQIPCFETGDLPLSSCSHDNSSFHVSLWTVYAIPIYSMQWFLRNVSFKIRLPMIRYATSVSETDIWSSFVTPWALMKSVT